MGTNYYLTKGGVRSEDREIVEHIGKSSSGFTFLFQGKHQRTVKDWVHRLNNLAPGEAIEAESRYIVGRDDFWADVGKSLMQVNKKEYANERAFTPEAMAIAMGFLIGESWQDGPFSFTDREFH